MISVITWLVDFKSEWTKEIRQKHLQVTSCLLLFAELQAKLTKEKMEINYKLDKLHTLVLDQLVPHANSSEEELSLELSNKTVE